ncbi:unnamed protein product [Cuscuta epithymum]|uniref:Uncharacterized protein n=1 Tax=Cuscuta epithymum TaxID=186058 RepID=A0AAV0F246_9ASTE|nr:unnamed protein product [Cuscuta epithymum]
MLNIPTIPTHNWQLVAANCSSAFPLLHACRLCSLAQRVWSLMKCKFFSLEGSEFIKWFENIFTSVRELCYSVFILVMRRIWILEGMKCKLMAAVLYTSKENYCWCTKLCGGMVKSTTCRE